MLNRLKSAIEKARLQNAGAAPQSPAIQTGAGPRFSQEVDVDAEWNRLKRYDLDPEQLLANRVVTLDKSDIAYVSFDVLRTRLLKVFAKRGWFRLGISSPTKGCGKSVVSANLALSIARQPEMRTLLVDADLRKPTLAEYFAIAPEEAAHLSVADFFLGETKPEDHLLRVRDNLAVAFSTEIVRDSAELSYDERTTATLEDVYRRFRPDFTIFDLPPMLAGDDVIAFLDNLDCILIIAGSGITRSDQLDECEHLFGDSGKFLGVLLNMSAGETYEDYYAEYHKIGA